MSDLRPAPDGVLEVGLPGWRWGPDLCAPFVEQLPVSGASICVIGSGKNQSTVCTSDALSARLDQLQFDLGEGPRAEVIRTGRPVLCADVQNETHPDWPVFGSAAIELGIGALFAFPIMMGAARLGVVDLYRETAGDLEIHTVRHALFLARMVATRTVDVAVRSAALSDVLEVKRSPGLRREVHQATGRIMVQLDTTATDAFAALSAYAFATGRTVDETAHDVLLGNLDLRERSHE